MTMRITALTLTTPLTYFHLLRNSAYFQTNIDCYSPSPCKEDEVCIPNQLATLIDSSNCVKAVRSKFFTSCEGECCAQVHAKSIVIYY